MGPKKLPAASDHDLFRLKLVNLIDLRHKPVLAELIDWSRSHDARINMNTQMSIRVQHQQYKALPPSV